MNTAMLRLGEVHLHGSARSETSQRHAWDVSERTYMPVRTQLPWTSQIWHPSVSYQDNPVHMLALETEKARRHVIRSAAEEPSSKTSLALPQELRPHFLPVHIDAEAVDGKVRGCRASSKGAR